ncbi:MAG: amino acid adenylation domain-containing protein [Pseudomonadota bacterium]
MSSATVHGLFRAVAAANPQRTAMAWDKGECSYAELDRLSDELAARLLAAGVGAESAVALYMERSPEAVIAALAVLKAGCAYLPLDPDYPRSRIAFVINDAGVEVLITSVTNNSTASGLAQTILVLELPAAAPVPQGHSSTGALPEKTTSTGCAYVMYTSGSTGIPKGVQIEHRSIVRLVGDVDYVRLDDTTRFLHAAPLGFDASTLEIWGPLLNGGRVIICCEPIPTGRGIAALIAAQGVNTAWLTAALFNAMVDDDPSQLRGLRQLLTGGEALSPPHIRRAQAALPDTELINGYGPTECTTFTTTYSIPRDFPGDALSVPIGRPIADTQVHVLDANLQPVAAGAEGELFVGGLGLARGYLGRPDLDAERFVRNPFKPGERLYRTGDLVRWLPQGVLEFVGRADQQVKIRGFRIEIGEIEARLGELAGVKACAVVALTHGAVGRRLVAYVVPHGADMTISGLRNALALILPEFMVPSLFVLLEALPVTANGKLDRAALPRPTGLRPALAEPYRAPRGPLETQICAAFADVLGLDRVGSLDGFMDLGGDSLSALRVLRRLRDAGLGDVSPATLFAAPTSAAMARALAAAAQPATPVARTAPPRSLHDTVAEPIAIIGMAGRFPGAADVDEFWDNLCAGRESIRFFRPDELDSSIPAALRADPAYVAARGVLEDAALFDAGFFGMSPLEAQLMDPQQRQFLEVAWHALEHAGHVPERTPGSIGLFGGMYNATYYQRHLMPRPDVTGRLGDLQVMLGNEKDYLTSRVAHKLGLSGPAVSVNTACSTSLVATVMAMDSLRTGACDLALAGGVAVTCPPNSGHLYQEGSMASVDGHTRPFDARAAGTVFSDGVAIVVLRRLRDAVAAGNTIYAIIRGGAINNDGSQRASFTAPSPEGQAAVIAAAHGAAGVDARSISYVEAHGTGTPLGDPIEVEGLTRAFRRHTDDSGFCGIGSLKSNVGHLVIAAGAASLIKTSLALHRGLLPPSIGFEQPNPQIDFAATPFRVNSALVSWPRAAVPRRAGVSSFGFGGTNAHVVLEEAPLPPQAAPSTRTHQLLPLSARSVSALTKAGAQLALQLAKTPKDGDPDTALADVAHTLRVGRRAFSHRSFIVAGSAVQAAEMLASADTMRSAANEIADDLPDVGFLCPGQGSQYVAMGRDLFAQEPVFRAAYEECCGYIENLTGDDPRAVFLSEDPAALIPTSVTQPAIFCLEYSLARLWMSWGVRPTSLIGHSVGEFVCAALAGVMRLDDAVALVLERGRLMQALPAGSMLSVRLPADQLAPRLPEGVVIAADNAPALCVASGPTEAIARLESELAADGVAARRLNTSHAFHSPMMDSVVGPLAERLAGMPLRPPAIPILSTVTATWLSDAEACSPLYWAQHLRQPVRFGAAVAQLLADPRRLLIEVGPRATLSTLARQAGARGTTRRRPVALPSLGDCAAGEGAALAAAVGQAWSLGVTIDWTAFVAHESRRRCALPGYPFERSRYWVDAPASLPGEAARNSPAVEAAVPATTVAPPEPQTSAPTRDDKLLARVRDLVEEVSGLEVDEADASTEWLALGLDSLTLTQLALRVQRSFDVKVSFRQVMEDYPSMSSLAEMLEAKLTLPLPPRESALPVEDEARGIATYDVKKAFGAIARIHTRVDALTPRQRSRLDAFITRYTQRTAKSKAYTVEHRPHMADPRVVNGFRPLTKELTYQLVVERSRGSRLWDIDGNEYIDVLQGFGMSLFGWQPDFIREAVHRQVDLGYEIGPQHVLAGETARLFCELSGMQRAAFCNTGSEAVMGAMRIARTVTGRSTIAIFTGAYHGIFDEVIVRGTRKLRTIPAAPGIMPESSQNMLVLEYGTPESLEILRQRMDTLAAVVVEPVQSRRPDFQPVEFLRQLRELTQRAGTALIFDEVVTGFRSHPRGAQGLFGIEADLATYGKVVGGGFSIGVIAGKSQFMDALDGGQWSYGDASIPSVGVTYFAGTFVRHPLALAAAKATLVHLKEAGPELQQRLTSRTSAMVAEINAAMDELGVPFKLNTFASLWRNVFTADLPCGDLIFAMLRDRGIHILDNFPCFLTTAHSEADIQAIVTAYRGAAAEMQASGFFPARSEEGATATIVESSVRMREVATTEPQREIWLADRMGPGASLAYNESVSIDLRGELNVEALRRAVGEVLMRHDALRAVFSSDGLVLRVPVEAPVPAVPLLDLSTAPGARTLLAALTARHVSELFDLQRGPLVRAQLVRLASDHHVLVLTGHHIVLDGWSFWVLVKEIAAFYGRAIDVSATALPPAPSFVDYAADVARHASTPEAGTNVAWWIERFADGGPTLALPTDRPRPRVRTQIAGRHDHILPADLIAGIKLLGAKHRASLFATLLAGFGGLLNRLTGQSDVVIGIAAAGQASAGLEGLVGHCVSMLPLRLSVDRHEAFAELVGKSRIVMLDAYDHQDVTFGRVLQALPITRDPGRLPLISVVFNIDQALSGESMAMSGVRLALESNPRTFETFELFVNAVDNGVTGMRLECQYNRDLFDEATIARWMQGFEHLLTNAVADPQTNVGRLQLLTDEDRALLGRWNDTAVQPSRAERIETLIAARIASQPDRIAVNAGELAMTYGELGSQSHAVTASLRAAGVNPGDRVGILVERDLLLLPALLGTLQAGACYVPLDPHFPIDRLAYMIADAGMGAVATTESLAVKFAEALAAVTIVRLDALRDVPPIHSESPGSVHDDAYVIYTSGSTGRPKGVRVPHAAVCNFLQSMQRHPGLASTAKIAAVTTISFDIAVLELLLPLAVGAEIVLATREQAGDGVALRQLLDRHDVDVMQATPSTWRLLIDAGWRGGPKWKALCGGEALPADLARALLERVDELWNMYGPTETTVWSSAHQVKRADGVIPVGVPVANTALHVLDDSGQLAPIGVVGELYIGGAGVTRGYLNRPELTGERFVPDFTGEQLRNAGVPSCGRLYRTGDLARWRNDGAVECLGRTDAQVKVRGYRIEPGEIEAVLASYPSVRQAVVTVHEYGPGDVRLVAYIVTGEAGNPTPLATTRDDDALRAYLARFLPVYMMPQHFVMLAAMPLTANGKVNRLALPVPTRPEGSGVESSDAPRGIRERLVARHFQQALSLPRLDIHADFFALGAHSLLAAQVAVRLGQELQRNVPMTAIFEYPTIASLAAWLEDEAPAREVMQAIGRRSSPGPAPLSLMQQRVWYIEQLQSGRTVFNVPSAHRLRGQLEVDSLNSAFAEMVRRQSVLRTQIETTAGEPSQVVLDSVDTVIPLEDLSGTDIARREALLQRRLEEEASLPFSLSRAPLFRVRLFRLDANEHVLFFMPHHIIWDGWSFDLFYEEMAALYAAQRGSQVPQVPALSIDYADFSVWQRKWMDGPTLERQLNYWREKLAGAPASLTLPVDRSRPAMQSGEGSTVWLRLPEATASALRELAAREHATLFMTLLAAWTLLLHRQCGQREIIVGTPVRGRASPELEAVMGFFVNAIPLRVAVDRGQNFLELLRAVRTNVIEAFGYQDVPFEHLVRVLDLPRDQSRFPLYQAFFSYQDARQRPSDWGDLRHENLPLFQPAAAQDVALWFLDGADGLVGGLNFNTDILDATTAEHLKSQFLALLKRLVEEPRQSVRELLEVDAEELGLLRRWNDVPLTLPDTPDVTSYIALANHDPARAAICFGEETLTYGQLAAGSSGIAAILRARGIAAGDVVALHVDRSPQMLVSLLGILQAGATYLPLDPEFPCERLAYMLDDSGARLTISDRDIAHLRQQEGRVLRLDQLRGTPLPANAQAEAAHAGGNAAYLIYTSGSTGRPKGVRVSHRAVINFLESMRRAPCMDANSRLAAVTTISFDIAVLELLLPLAVGATIVLASKEQATDGNALRQLLEEQEVNVMQATPATWRLLIASGWRGGPDWKALCGGEAMPVDVAESLLERVGELWNMYGPTETTVWSTCARIEAGQGEISIGRPIANTQVWVLDDAGDVAPIGVAGEIHIGGEGVALGYHNRAGLTAERFVPDRFSTRNQARLYRTGDLGRWRSDGQLQHLGRTDFQVKLRGYRIELGEIEHALMRMEGIAQAVVVARALAGDDQRLVAYVAGRDGREPDVTRVRDGLCAALPLYMIPAAIVPLERLPLTPNGKIDRGALPDPELAPAVRAVADQKAPQTSAELLVAEVWRELLKVREVSVLDNFLDLGGHSLLIMRAVAMLESRTGVALSPRAFVFQTLGQIAAEYAGSPLLRGAPIQGDVEPEKPRTRHLLSRVLSIVVATLSL